MKRRRLIYRAKERADHFPHFVEVEGSFAADGSPSRISMDAATLQKHKFITGQTITWQQAVALLGEITGGDRGRLVRLIYMAHQLGPNRTIEINDEED